MPKPRTQALVFAMSRFSTENTSPRTTTEPDSALSVFIGTGAVLGILPKSVFPAACADLSGEALFFGALPPDAAGTLTPSERMTTALSPYSAAMRPSSVCFSAGIAVRLKTASIVMASFS